MKISIKQAGIIVAILAIIALAVVGCFCAISVKDSTINSVLKKDDVMTTADKEYLLQGECDEMAEIWNAAMTESVQYNRHIKLTLMNDWVAKDGDTKKGIFGEGFGFGGYGCISVANGAEISIDLNGFSIDRNLTNKDLIFSQKPTTAIIEVMGTLNLLDSKYDIAEVNRVYEQYKNQPAGATYRTLLENLSKIKCGKITGNDSRAPEEAAGIHVDGTLNIYGGMILGNKSPNDSVGEAGVGGIKLSTGASLNMYNGAVVGNTCWSGGGIYAENAKVVNIQGGIIAENVAEYEGGGIFFTNCNSVKVSNCFISHNRALDGAGIFSNNSGNVRGNYVGELSINNSEFIANHSSSSSSAMRLMLFEKISINNTKILKNLSNANDTIFISQSRTVNIANVEIQDNISGNGDEYSVGAALDISAPSSMSEYMQVDMKEVLIANNELHSPRMGAPSAGGMCVNATARTTVIMNSVKIVKNRIDVDYLPGGFNSYGKSQIRIDGTVVITDNTNTLGESNFAPLDSNKLTIASKLEGGWGITRIGVTNNTGVFTVNYSVYNKDVDPNKYFYSDWTDKLMIVENGEVRFGTETRPTQTALTWRYKANSGDTTTYDITGSTITLEYNPDGYTITNSANSVVQSGYSTSATKQEITYIGTYGFTTTNSQNYTNPILTVTIVPKKVDIVWSNTELTYNGKSQLPTATIAEYAYCTVTVTGGQTNVGNGYIATATTLNDSNYEINPATSSTMFNIKPADLTIKVTTTFFRKEYNGKNIILPDGWYTLSATLLGKDQNMPLDLVFDIDHNAFIPQFNGKDSATAVGDYIISTKPFTASEVFKNNLNYNVSINYVNTGNLTITVPSVVRPTDNSGYDFVLSENGRRVNYKDKDLIHGDNDSAITTFVLGNITPNTSVQTFVNNLSFDTTKITIYNKAGEVVFGTGAISYYTDNINNGLEVAIGTGWRIEYTKLTGGEETIYLSVLGDLTGDGKVNAADVNYIRQLISNPTMYANLNDKQYIQLAALIINNGKLTNADAEILWFIVCGKINIKDVI